jgi:hypothetical protein
LQVEGPGVARASAGSGTAGDGEDHALRGAVEDPWANGCPPARWSPWQSVSGLRRR